MADLFLTSQGVGSRLSVQNSESIQSQNSSISISGKAPYSLCPCFPRKPWNHRTLSSSGSLRKSHPVCPALQPQVSLLSSEVSLHRKVTRLSLLNLSPDMARVQDLGCHHMDIAELATSSPNSRLGTPADPVSQIGPDC